MNKVFRILLIAASAAWIPGAVLAGDFGFKSDVFPVLRMKCLECHQPGGAGHEKSGLDMTTYESLMKGTKNGPAVIPGDPLTSTLMMVLDKRTHKEIRMPFKRLPLTKEERGVIRKWIARGAKND
ncbi:MAG: hypothetical protein A3G18_02200 [Rhodospirillales bacterium RIFCSPLOWO2_12_FULL_58_28]|nr:MAG: hypothetical protein A3H92_07315 [Rhodospirillales bacterium RIFCSPLOWO2_02_FULL_58_16]OHC79097.1 MAG: hypothetical protein A3G18_02200 [Rhodospirillales bacterium RIFCSPLOWO2_12_FULL_58_28]